MANKQKGTHLDLPARFQFTSKIKSTRQASFKYLCETLPGLELVPVLYKDVKNSYSTTIRMHQIIPSSCTFGRNLEAKYKNVKCFVVPRDRLEYRRIAVVTISPVHQYIIYQATFDYSNNIYVLDTRTHERTITNNLQDAIDYIEITTGPLESLPLLVHHVKEGPLKKAILKRLTEGV